MHSDNSPPDVAAAFVSQTESWNTVKWDEALSIFSDYGLSGMSPQVTLEHIVRHELSLILSLFHRPVPFTSCKGDRTTLGTLFFLIVSFVHIAHPGRRMDAPDELDRKSPSRSRTRGAASSPLIKLLDRPVRSRMQFTPLVGKGMNDQVIPENDPGDSSESDVGSLQSARLMSVGDFEDSFALDST